jgi:hypothetical protein
METLESEKDNTGRLAIRIMMDSDKPGSSLSLSQHKLDIPTSNIAKIDYSNTSFSQIKPVDILDMSKDLSSPQIELATKQVQKADA